MGVGIFDLIVNFILLCIFLLIKITAKVRGSINQLPLIKIIKLARLQPTSM